MSVALIAILALSLLLVLVIILESRITVGQAKVWVPFRRK
jgi:hypothetical protein